MKNAFANERAAGAFMESCKTVSMADSRKHVKGPKEADYMAEARASEREPFHGSEQIISFGCGACNRADKHDACSLCLGLQWP